MMRASAAALRVGHPLGQVLDPIHADQPALMPFISPASPCSIGSLLRRVYGNVATAGTWVSANDPVAVPFFLAQPATVFQLGWLNGSAAGGNIAMGIYDSSWVRKVSTGSTVGAGNSVWQFVDVADTVLLPGKYWMVLCLDNVTANRISIFNVNSQPTLALAGVQDSATDAFPLPDPLTNMAAAATAVSVPNMLVALRSLV